MKPMPCLILCASCAMLCSCGHEKQEVKELRPSSPIYEEPISTTRPDQFVPSRVTSPNMIPQATQSPSPGQESNGVLPGVGGISGAQTGAGDDGGSSGGGADAPGSAAASGPGGSAGTGHTDPLGDPTGMLVAPEEKLEIPASQQQLSGGGGDAEEPKPETEPQPDRPQQQAQEQVPPEMTGPAQLSSEEIERLPPERRAAVMRYLKRLQEQRQKNTGGAQ